MPLDAGIEGYAEVVPDLVMEVVSPSNLRGRVHDEAVMWLSHGTSLVWVVHPDTRTVDVHRANGAVSTIGGESDLGGGDVLPGFSCSLSGIFDV